MAIGVWFHRHLLKVHTCHAANFVWTQTKLHDSYQRPPDRRHRQRHRSTGIEHDLAVYVNRRLPISLALTTESDTYNDQTHQYDQTTYFNGKNISFLSTGKPPPQLPPHNNSSLTHPPASGHAFRLTANTECNSNPTCGTMPAFCTSAPPIPYDNH